MAHSQKPPRLSVNELAHYMIASDTGRIGILRRAKTSPPNSAAAIRYTDARRAICAFLADPTRNVSHLTNADLMLSQRAGDPSETNFRQNDAKHSIAVLRKIQSMSNTVAPYLFAKAPGQQPRLPIGGIEVSVRTDVLVIGKGKQSERMGAAVLRMDKDDATTPFARNKRKEMGLFAATVIRLHVERNLLETGKKVDSRLCMSIDVQRGEIFLAPNSRSQRMQNIRSACQMIAALWPQIQ